MLLNSRDLIQIPNEMLMISAQSFAEGGFGQIFAQP
jgi:hypothetical protein